MKRYQFLISVIIIFLMFSSCSKKNDEFNQEKEKYLAAITINKHPWKYGERSKNGTLVESYFYDENENLTIYTLYDQSRTILGTTYEYDAYTFYSYDERNRVTKKIEQKLFKSTYVYDYNDFDSVAKVQEYGNDGGLLYIYTYEYDNNRRKIKVTQSDAANSGYVYSYSYANNTITEVTTKLKDGSLYKTVTWIYDSNQNLLKQTEKYATGNEYIEKEYQYEYDSDGRIVKIKDIKSYNQEIRDYTYNEDGTINTIHISYPNSYDQYDLIYTYTWE